MNNSRGIPIPLIIGADLDDQMRRFLLVLRWTLERPTRGVVGWCGGFVGESAVLGVCDERAREREGEMKEGIVSCEIMQDGNTDDVHQ